MFRGKLVYQDKTRRVTKHLLKSETNPYGAYKHSQCDNKSCRKDGIYNIEGIVYSWILHTCRKHMKTMTAETLKGKHNIESMTQLATLGNEMFANVMANR